MTWDVLKLCCRNKTGILGWRSEKTETVNGYEAKVSGSLISRTVQRKPSHRLIFDIQFDIP